MFKFLLQFKSNKEEVEEQMTIEQMFTSILNRNFFVNPIEKYNYTNLSNRHPFVNGESVFYVELSSEDILKYFPMGRTAKCSHWTDLYLSSDYYDEYLSHPKWNLKAYMQRFLNHYKVFSRKDLFGDMFNGTVKKIYDTFIKCNTISNDMIEVLLDIVNEMLDFINNYEEGNENNYLKLLQDELKDVKILKGRVNNTISQF